MKESFEIIAATREPVRYQTQLTNRHELAELLRATLLAQAKDLCVVP